MGSSHITIAGALLRRALLVLLVVGVAISPREAEARKGGEKIALLGYAIWTAPITFLMPGEYGVQFTAPSLRHGAPRFHLGWTYQIPLVTDAKDWAYARHRLLVGALVTFHSPHAPPGEAAEVWVRAGYRFVLDLDPGEMGPGLVVGGDFVMTPTGVLNMGVSPEIGVRFRPDPIFPIVLSLVARCDVLFGETTDRLRPSLVVRISLF